MTRIGRWITLFLPLPVAMAHAAQPAEESGPALPELLLPEREASREIDPEEQAARARRYKSCIAMTARTASAALSEAERWRTEDGGLPARHCAAVALTAQGSHSRAADILADIAAELQSGEAWQADRPPDMPRLMGNLYGQIGNSLLLARKPGEAVEAFSAGLNEFLDPRNAAAGELYLDRARAFGLMGQFERALGDLDRAQDILGARGDIALYRASALRRLDRLEDAAQAVATAIKADGESAQALIERAAIHASRDDIAAARRDWQAILDRWPQSVAARTAEANLQATEAAGGANRGN